MVKKFLLPILYHFLNTLIIVTAHMLLRMDALLYWIMPDNSQVKIWSIATRTHFFSVTTERLPLHIATRLDHSSWKGSEVQSTHSPQKCIAAMTTGKPKEF